MYTIIDLKEYIINTLIVNLDIYNLPTNVKMIKREEIKLEKEHHFSKTNDYYFTCFLEIMLYNTTYLIDVQGVGNYNKQNDDIISCGEVYYYQENFNSIYDLKNIED